MHLQFAYYESSLVVEYIIDQYGIDVLKRVLVDLSVGMPINESLQRYTGSLEQLDRDFAEHARKLAQKFFPDADWSELDLPQNISETQLLAIVKKQPNHWMTRRRLAQRYLQGGKHRQALPQIEKMIELYPQDASAWEMKTIAHRGLEQTDKETEALEKWALLSSDAVGAYLRLMERRQEDKDWTAAAKNARRLLAVNPLIRPPHRCLANAAEQLGKRSEAIDALQTLLILQPADPVDVHYRLAKLLQQEKRIPEAKRHVLQCLEEAPRYRDAHHLLLELIKKN